MLEILLGLICGGIVCVFGMWCFIRGQQNGLQIVHNETPVQIKNPVQAVSDSIQTIKEEKKIVETQDSYEKFAAWNAELPTDKEV